MRRCTAETAGDNKREGSYAEWVTIKKKVYGVRVCVWQYMRDVRGAIESLQYHGRLYMEAILSGRYVRRFIMVMD